MSPNQNDDPIARDVQIALEYEEALELAHTTGTAPPRLPEFVASRLPHASKEERAKVIAFIEFNLAEGGMEDVAPEPVPADQWEKIEQQLRQRRRRP